jgi:hypothetical protein
MEASMSDASGDTSRVTLSDRAYWNDEQHGFSVRLTGNSDVQAVFFVPLLAPDLAALLKDLGGRRYRMMPGAERLTLGQSVNSAIRRGLHHEDPHLQLMSALEVRDLDDAQARHEKRH